MKELVDKYLVNRLKDLLIYQEEFTKFMMELNTLQQESPDSITEEDKFKMLVIAEDAKKCAVEVEVIVDLYRRTKEDLPKEYVDIVSEIPGYKEGKRSELYTYIVDNGVLVERENGLLANRLEMSKASEAYQYFSKKRSTTHS